MQVLYQLSYNPKSRVFYMARAALSNKIVPLYQGGHITPRF